MMNRYLALALLGLACNLSSWADERADWNAWRGPLSIGSIGNGKFPTEFSAEKYSWRTALPGRGCSTPIVHGNSIFVTAPVDGSDALLSYDLHGQEQWRTVFGKENAGKHRNGSGCNASAVTDGETVFVYFKSGMFAAVDVAGKVRWKHDLVAKYGEDTLFWDHGTSPVLTKKYVVMTRMHQGESWLAAFDKLSGELIWKTARNYTTPVECDHGYTTPLVIEHAGQESLLTWGAEHITIHNASDGKLTWWCGGFNPEGNKLWPAIASPVIVDDMVVVAYGRNDRGIPRLFGVRLAGSGDVTSTNHVWKRDDVGTFVPTPAVHQGKIILVRDRGEVACLEPRTGETVWTDAFPKSRSNFYASPLVAGDKLYAPREDGLVFVGSLNEGKFKLLAENNMGESIIASPVPLGNGILLRGEKHLFYMAAE